MMVRWILQRRNDVDWMDVSQDREQSRALVNTALNVRISIKSWEVLE
jgi:hypothetical protein